MKAALVIHPRLFVYAGGEILCMYVIKALKEAGFKVTLASDVYEPEKVQAIYRMGDVLAGVGHIKIPDFHPLVPRFLVAQRSEFARNTRIMLAEQGTASDVVFSTQSSIFTTQNPNVYHFIYNTGDLFAYPSGNWKLPPLSYETPLYKAHYYFGMKAYHRLFLKDQPKVREFLSLSHYCQYHLQRMGFQNSSFIKPPVQLDKFTPKPKRKQVLQVTRIVKQKRLEWFFEIARRLSEYSFIIVGKDQRILGKRHDDYFNELMTKKPPNVEYVPGVIRDMPQILEESKVYLYTGVEQGIGIALCEAMSAGCFPLSPRLGGGGEVLQLADVGYQYDTIDEAVAYTRKALESDHDPWMVREKAKIFGADIFEEKIRKMVS